ncbi:MAG TPA: TIGR04282 family arsenosugar biosynthesis glycosyltransferase [Candidatus Polarisedimenticolia bacterium]|nr:TIGR04282 family arsenosugar biosynthesis glycosyltransferase [Candidatus Polarisedimenticolia bacterium]
MKTHALVIYARPPVLGTVKTRLVPSFSAGEALALYEAMLADAIERLAGGIGGDTTLFVSWASACRPSEELAGLLRGIVAEIQIGDDLGERMAATIQSRLRSGFARVVLVGADTPNLPLVYVRRAFEALAEADVVLGPAADGGYYLLGCRRLHPRLFQKVPWGTEKVLSITRQRIKDGGISHHELSPWYDVDTPDDVARLWIDLQHMNAKGPHDLPRRTFQLLSAWMPGRPQTPPRR